MKLPNKKILSDLLARPALLIFLLTWFAYGAAINSSNLIAFDLQQIGVEAMVERHHFYLEGAASPQMTTKGDVFKYDEHLYAAKQPGQFMAGAVVFFVLRIFGLNYLKNYLLTSALVIFFTASLVLAASAAAFFKLARAMSPDGADLFWPTGATLAYAFATTIFPYSGIAHHDALATGYLAIAFYFIFQLSRREVEERTYLKSGAAGLLLGLTITTSMLPFFMVLLCVIYFLSLRRWGLLPVFLISLLAGLLPLFIFDFVSFGNPFRLANVAGAGMFADTFWQFAPRNLGDKLVFNARALVFYVPVFAIGLFGLSYYPREIKRSWAFLALIGLLIVLAAFVFNIKSDGDCQFGPRYLLPAMPFACLGIIGFSHLSRSAERRLAAVAVVLAGVYSFVVNLVGALRGAMGCLHGENAFWNHVAALGQGEKLAYPLAWWLLLPLIICGTLLITTIAERIRANRSTFRIVS
ncbi:MAG: hypothetical protein H0U60_16310 [Blastocatellia bacterium]|nr:hypothetical protein [Blastocatellia bacterium]